MFSRDDIDRLRQIRSQFIIYQLNGHDVTIHSTVTGHDWIIISYYDRESCVILHRHSRKYPYHRQRGNYRSLKAALDYIMDHEEWVINKMMHT